MSGQVVYVVLDIRFPILVRIAEKDVEVGDIVEITAVNDAHTHLGVSVGQHA